MEYPHEAITSKVDRLRSGGVRSRVLTAALVALLAGVSTYAFILHRQLEQLRVDSSRIIEAHLKTIALRNQQVAALDQLATGIDAFNREFGARLGRVDMNNLESSIQHVRHEGHLPEDAKRTLDEFEKNAADIDAMTEKVKEYERYLGAPITVKRGQTQSDIAKEYLVEQAKLSPDDAEKVIRRTAMDWEVEPGNEVFNLYHDGILLSTVTQGTARRSPLMVQWARRRAAQRKREELETRVNELEALLVKMQGHGSSRVPPSGGFWLKRSDGTTAFVTQPDPAAAPGAAMPTDAPRPGTHR